MRYHAVMKTLTVRHVSSRLAQALEREKRRRDVSLNALVLEVLSEGLGVGPGNKRRNGLARLAGSWPEAEFQRFQAAVEGTERIDDELWR